MLYSLQLQYSCKCTKAESVSQREFDFNHDSDDRL